MTLLYNYPSENTVEAEENKQQILSKETKEDFLEEMVFELQAERGHFRNKECHAQSPGGQGELGVNKELKCHLPKIWEWEL